MRISVDGGGYLAAATGFADANHAAALAHDTLSGKLSGFGAMAGDDSGAAEFAAAYDQAATDGLAALADLVDAFAAVGRLTDASLANHRLAEDHSVLRELIPGAIVYDGSTLPDHDYVAVLDATPPGSLGGDLPTLTDRENWILDHLEAIAWPNADTDRLRDAAHAWRTTAESVDRLTDHCDAASRGLASERSPEIPFALDAIADLRGTVTELADHHTALADACEAYADHVDTKRAELHLLLQEILQMVVEGIVISAAIGLISAGAGALAGGGVVAARVAAQSPRFAAILTALSALTAATTHQLRVAGAGLKAVRARLDKFLRVPVRTDAGHFGGAYPYRSGWLVRHERSGSHTQLTHSARSIDELHERIDAQSRIPFASSFRSDRDAEYFLERVLTSRRGEIEEWLKNGSPRKRLDEWFDISTGISVNRSHDVLDVQGVRAVLVRDDTMPLGYRILTSFPQP